MALDIDGYAVLGVVATTPDAFPDIRAEVAKTGRTLVTKQMKAKALPLAGLRRIRDALGPENFALIVDGLSDAEAKSMVVRLDKHHPDLKTAPSNWHRGRLGELASGQAPADRSKAPKPTKTPKPRAEKASPPQRALGSRPFAATWDGQDHDAPKPRGKRKA